MHVLTTGAWHARWKRPRPLMDKLLAPYQGQRNFAGLSWCGPNQRHVGFGSWCERDQRMLLDFDHRVSGIASPPLRVTLPGSLPQSSHVPAYFVGPSMTPAPLPMFAQMHWSNPETRPSLTPSPCLYYLRSGPRMEPYLDYSSRARYRADWAIKPHCFVGDTQVS